MTDPNPRPVSSLSRQQQADAARGEALAFYGRALSTDGHRVLNRSSTVGCTTENHSVKTWVSRKGTAA